MPRLLQHVFSEPGRARFPCKRSFRTVNTLSSSNPTESEMCAQGAASPTIVGPQRERSFRVVSTRDPEGQILGSSGNQKDGGPFGRAWPRGLGHASGHGAMEVPHTPTPPYHSTAYGGLTSAIINALTTLNPSAPCIGVPTACPSFLDKDIANPTQGDDLRSLKVGPGEGVAAGKAGYRFAVGRPGDQIGVHSPRSAPPSNQSPRRIMRGEAPIGFTDRWPVGLNYSCAPRGFT